jgi:hypothetical protein
MANFRGRVLAPDTPLKVSGRAGLLLLKMEYRSESTCSLIDRANWRLADCRRQHLLTVTDRATAIAVLEGINFR